jgi:flagellar biosynthesis protein FlhF
VVHTFRASRFEEAIAQVKRVLGSDALIVSRRDLAASEWPVGKRGGVEITAMSNQDAQSARVKPGTAGPLSLLERRLQRDGVPDKAVRTLIDATRAKKQGPLLGMSALEEVLTDVLAEELVFGGGVGQGARVTALVGPTGVGKTTTIAKIAAHEQLVNRRPVGLISIDQYRIGGIEQLARYADLIGCPMQIASDAHTLEVALRRLSECEIVLVDTAGRSLRDGVALSAMADTLQGVQETVEVQLCLPVATRERELGLAVEHFSDLRPSRLTCTKVDEALCCGAIIAAHVQSGLPLGYFTTGQRVPEDFSVASAELLAALLCGGDIN